MATSGYIGGHKGILKTGGRNTNPEPTLRFLNMTSNQWTILDERSSSVYTYVGRIHVSDTEVYIFPHPGQLVVYAAPNDVLPLQWREITISTTLSQNMFELLTLTLN